MSATKSRAQRRPDLRHWFGICLTCHHWQIDVRPGAISDLGGWRDTMKAIGEAHAAHVWGTGEQQCPGAGGRIKFGDTWVEAPRMESGKPADGTLALQPFPRWWVAK